MKYALIMGVCERLGHERVETTLNRVCEIKSVNRHSMISDGAVSS